MLDINLIRTNPDLVRENIKKKFQDAKLPLVDEVLELDKKKMQLTEGLKSLGVHEVPIKLHPKVTTTLKVHVVEE